jgi:hypothetical protein
MALETNWKKYAYTFIITALIFGTAIMASDYFNQRKINEIKNIESRIAVDILSSETQFSLLSELTCKEIGSSFLSKELSELGDKLSYTEQSRGTDDEEVINLKRYYSLLQIKDFLLLQKVQERCGQGKALSIIYFYSNKGDCQDCAREGYVLTRLRQDYPELRVYSFDYNLDLGALKTLISIYNITNNPPALLISDNVSYGFKSIDDIKTLIPELKKIDADKARAESQANKPKVSTSTKPQ